MTSAHGTRLAHHEATVYEEPATIATKRELNELAPVSRLPPEILSNIFIYVTRSVRSPYCQCYLLWFSHVCFKWRQVALHTPRVWSNVTLTWNGEFMCELFARSKEAPLHVRTPRLGALPYQVILGIISEHVHRIHTLRLWRTGGLPGSDELALPSAVELRRLELDAHGAQPSVLTSHGTSCQWPKLSHLKIRSRAIFMSWSHPILSTSLTHFTFWGSIHDDEAWNNVLAALSSLPSLKVLNLSRVLPRSSCADTLPVVELSRLEELRLSDQSTNCIALLQHVTSPNLAFISLGLTLPSNDDVSAASNEVAMKVRDTASLDTRFRSVHLEYSNEFLDIMAWTKLVAITELAKALDTEIRSHPYIDLTLRDRGFTLNIFHVYNSGLLSGVRSLYLEAEYSWEPHWEGLSAAMPHLRELGVAARDGSAWGIARYFAPPTIDTSEPSARPLFPGLKVLMLIGVRFCIATGRYIGETSLVLRLQAMLRSRGVAGYALDELIIREPVNFSTDELLKLRSVVGHLEWDSDDVTWDSEEDEEDYESEGSEDRDEADED